MLNLLSGLCNGVVIQNTSTCKEGLFCCDTTRAVPTQRPRPVPRPTTTTRRPFYPTTTQAPDYREDCPGTCIMSFISFTCFRKWNSNDLMFLFPKIDLWLNCAFSGHIFSWNFEWNLLGNAEMTNLFKCKKDGTECCAPKSKILEYQGLVNRNDSFPVFVNSQPQQHIPQYLPNYPNNYPNNYQQIPQNAYAPVPNPYQPIPPQALPPQQSIPNTYAVAPATNYITQPQPVPQQLPQQSIAQNAYAPIPPQNYAPIPPNALQYSPNAVPNNVVSHVNLSPAYSTPGIAKWTYFEIFVVKTL